MQSGPDDVSPAEVTAAPGQDADARWFRAVADYTYDWESWHGADGRLIWVNPAVQRLTGYTVAECLAMADYPLPMVAPEHRPCVADAIDSARHRTSGDSLEFRVLARDGQVRWMSLSWQPMYDGRRAYLGFRTSVRDVTERHRLRDELRLHAEHLEQLVQERTERLRQLEQRQRHMEKLAALGQLAAGVAHEINNPLAGMRNAFELIRSSLPPEHEHFELLALVDREIERISGITHQMYQLYGRAPQQPRPFAMADVAREVTYLLEHAANKHAVRLRFDAPAPESTEVCLAEGEVRQILYNLIQNAIQASSPDDPVAVRITANKREVAVHVEDRGAGIARDVLPRIFDPFFSTKQEFSTKQGGAHSGMGLGLSVSRSLIEAMGGRIDVASVPGRGSRFTARFPRSLHHPGDSAAGESIVGGAAGNRRDFDARDGGGPQPIEAGDG